MFEDSQGNLRRNMTEQEFDQWKELWLREKGCPFFACGQALYRKVCGNTLLCGCLFDYEMYKSKPWIKVCDIALAVNEREDMPTKSCAACTGSMCLKVEDDHDLLIGKSFCRPMNDYYEASGYPVDRSIEKYIASWGAFIIPVIGEEAYLYIQNNPSIIEKIQGEIENAKRGRD